jgi:hypothetical protein
MNEEYEELLEKLVQYLLHLFDTSTTYDIHEFSPIPKYFLKKSIHSGRVILWHLEYL